MRSAQFSFNFGVMNQHRTSVNDSPQISDMDLKELCRIADACELSVLRRLVGLPVRGRVAARIDRAIFSRLAP